MNGAGGNPFLALCSEDVSIPPDIICGRIIAAAYSGQRGIIDMLHS